MIVHTAHLVCKPEHIDAFHVRLRRHATTTREREQGCKRFDIHQNAENPGLFLLYEIYEDQAALDIHRASPHFVEFRKDTADWVSGRTWWFWTKLSAASA
ncbi:putative quinol monooxygenase [Pseudorhodoplanes sp.]|uniref:putative quinol monooxygenase n=1 Tax=Pseudorhodoplanes sp. TaxID=1934341 RepID=UPI003D12B68E